MPTSNLWPQLISFYICTLFVSIPRRISSTHSRVLWRCCFLNHLRDSDRPRI
ncbi:hypothetical protein PISMIDRAFT_325810 [Pisolithus microcarpus 441]|uniref:Unplaced genomic scaffold scaffold_21, whole genome shotgun sequence n=1 Tax=Pisolithus microcarpus 441 TaxID=765257 RepID=A0A0C9ZIL2_9AGAM|nr:hypothetical protein PISMIDRAFT_325810 [Pisolithus microcarpus 441]